MQGGDLDHSPEHVVAEEQGGERRGERDHNSETNVEQYGEPRDSGQVSRSRDGAWTSAAPRLCSAAVEKIEMTTALTATMP